MYSLYSFRKEKHDQPRHDLRRKPGPVPPKHRLDEPKKGTEGCIPLLHPDLHEFRNVAANNVYLRHYLPDPMRVQQATELFRRSCLAEPYNSLSPHNRVSWLRASARVEAVRHSVQTRPKQVARVIAHRRYITADPPTLGAAILHKFRDRNRSLDAAEEEFSHYSRDFRQPVWKTLDLYSGEPYVDGLEALGDVRKKREKEKELSPAAFLAGGQGATTSGSQSLRSYKAETTSSQCRHVGCGGKMSSIYSWNVPITVPPVHDTTPCMDYMLAYEECIVDAVPNHVQVFHPNWPSLWPRLLTDGNLRPDLWDNPEYIKGPLGPNAYQWAKPLPEAVREKLWECEEERFLYKACLRKTLELKVDPRTRLDFWQPEENYKKALGRRLLINPNNRYSFNMVPQSSPNGDLVMRELWKEFVSEGNSP